MPVNFMELIAGTSVDLKGLETGLQKGEQKVEESAKRMAGSFSLMAAGIAAAIVGVVVVALEKAIKTTAEWGLEMYQLSNRMGMTTREATVLVEVMERFGIHTGIAARSMQMMSMQIKQTQEAIDPFQTRMGKLLGTLRDVNGQALSMSQVLDLARQKVSAARTETERLQIAQSLVGVRMGGQLVPMLKMTNEEFAKMKERIEAGLPPVEKAAEQALAYKVATVELEDAFRDMRVELGTKLLPTLIDIVHAVTYVVEGFRGFKEAHPAIASLLSPLKAMQDMFDSVILLILQIAEALHLVNKGTVDAFVHMKEYQEAGRKAALEQERNKDAAEGVGEAVERTAKREKELVQLVKERTSLMEKARTLGMAGETQIQAAVETELRQLEEQRRLLEEELSRPGVTEDTRLKIETEIQKNRIEAAQVVAKTTADMYKQEELQIKANGAMSLTTEIELLQRKLSDERIVGDERLKVEAELYEKRKQFVEDVIKYGQQLGFVSVDQEIAYRKQRAAEQLGKGDVLGAAQEIIKARDLALKQADQVMEFTKKLRVVSLQDEIEYQKQKLAVVKGNAEEEMKVLSQIADLDKQLYDKRLEFSLNYTQSIIDQYNKIQKAAKDTGEVETFERARVESERQLVETTREAGQVLRGGGTAAQRQAAVEFAQYVNKQVEQMQSIGKEVTGIWRDAADTAKDILKAASGGEEVRAPGGPSPTVGSLLSPAEGLATAGLARGSDIPRLDTSFTDLAIRIRDVLLGTIPNIQNFSNALADGTRKLALITGTQLNPGIIGPGGGATNLPTQGSSPLAAGSSTPAPSTVAPGGVPVAPSAQVGVGGFAQSDQLVKALNDLSDSLKGLPTDLGDRLQTQAAANAQSLQDALEAIQAARSQNVKVDVGVDPNTGDMIVTRLVQELTQ